MKTLSAIFCMCVFTALSSVSCDEESEVPEQLQDLQTEFWLPYSITEDVDFSITRPEGYGCYQWYIQIQYNIISTHHVISFLYLLTCLTYYSIFNIFQERRKN